METSILQRIRSADARRGLERHFPPFFLSLGLKENLCDSLAQLLSRQLSSSGPSVLEYIGETLDANVIHDRWEQALSFRRAAVMARWIAPFIRGHRMLDLLCGDGAVGIRTAEAASVEVDLVEREGNMGVVHRPWLTRIHSHDRFVRELPASQSYGTVLLCTVLHHEQDPVATLELAARLGRRVIVVENCVDEMYTRDYHLLVDAIFNRSLYHTELAFPGEHRTATEWKDLCAAYGRVRVVESALEIPGIPLAHSLLVIDR